MKALGGSYLKLYVSRQRERERERERVGLDFGICRHDFGFLVHQKRVGDGLVSFRANCVASIIPTAASAQTGLEFETEEIQTLNSDQPKTVRVRFKLRKECAFGQHFLVVGDDPSLGSWDPSQGVPLNWSEGHVWTALVDVPSGKVINYKFILKEINGGVSWQPGPDRVLEAWDTSNTISVAGDWEVPDLQIIYEEEGVDDVNQLSLNGSGSGSLIAENLNQIFGEEGDGVDGDDDDDDDDDEYINDHSDKPWRLMVAENIVMQEEGVPVLVPGLASVPPEETEAEEAEEEEEEEEEVSSIVGSKTTALSDEIIEFAKSVFDEIEDSTDQNHENNSIVEDITAESAETEDARKPEIHASATLHYAEAMAVEEKPRFDLRLKKMERNMQWGRQTLHKFLANLGFMQAS